jgi:hypothetical protein
MHIAKGKYQNGASPNVLSLKSKCFLKELEVLQETSSSESLEIGRWHYLRLPQFLALEITLTSVGVSCPSH